MSILSDDYRFELKRAGFTDRQINTMAQKFYNLRNISPLTKEEYVAISKYSEAIAQLAECQGERDTMKDLWGEMLERYGSYKEQLTQVTKQRDELVTALAELRSVCFDRRKANDEFERLGELYYREFGRLRPGKDDPMRNSSDEENTKQYDEWSRKRTEAAIDLADDAIAKVGAHCVLWESAIVALNLPTGTKLYTHPAPDVSEGWQLVPKEPTLEMIAAGDPDLAVSYMRAVWNAMLAAAPKPGESE